MRRHAKGSNSGQATRLGSKLLLTCAMAIFAALVLGVTLAAATVPTVSIENASEVSATSAKAKGTVDPQDHETSYHFEYATQADFSDAASFGSGGSLGEGSGSQLVTATATNLAPNVTYYLRLVATNEDGVSKAVAASTFTTDAIAPSVGNLRHTQIAPGAVIIAGFANPHNSATSDCHFEYGVDDSYDQSVSCEALPPTNNKANLVRAKLSGLTSGASYHFLLSATNGVGNTESADAVFVARAVSSQPACANAGSIGVGFLPDCRAWEMVSPQDKNGGDVMSTSLRIRAAADGSAAQFASLTPFDSTEGLGVAADYFSKRSSLANPGNQGWATHGIIPHQEPMSLNAGGSGAEPDYRGVFSDDFSRGVFLALSPLGDDDTIVPGSPNFYRRNNLFDSGPGAYELLTECLSPRDGACAAPVIPSIIKMLPRLAGGSADLGHVLIESPLQLTTDAPPSFSPTTKLYDGTGGALRFAGVLPNGSAAANSVAGKGGASEGMHTSHAISNDGSHVFFTDASTGMIYARINARSTVQLNTSERTTLDTEAPATYWDASGDGSRIFFTSNEALTDDAPLGSQKLYMWKQAETNETQQLTVEATSGSFTLAFNEAVTDPIDVNATAQDVQNKLEELFTIKPGNVTVSGGRGSTDGNSLYSITFIGDFAGANVADLEANGSELSGGAATSTLTISQPVHNLTFLSGDNEPADGNVSGVEGAIGTSASGDRVYFIALGQLVAGAPSVTFSGAGLYSWEEGQVEFVGEIEEPTGDGPYLLDGLVPLNFAQKQAYVTPTGDLVFVSSSGNGLLSAHGGVDYNQRNTCPTGNHNVGEGCLELYVYSASTGELQCASCNPSGVPAIADARNRITVSSAVGGTGGADYLGRPLSDDGRYAFFSTGERLVPEDTNGISDAYVYDTTIGKPSLLSSGESPQPSYFMDASADGKDAFFTTAQALSDWDIDGNYDLYDARIEGGFPEPLPPPASCQGDACQPTPLNINDSTPSSATFVGPGNQSSDRKTKIRCANGQRKVKARNGKGRCVGKRSKRRTAGNNRRATR